MRYGSFWMNTPSPKSNIVQFHTVAIVPTTADWNTTNPHIDWEMEKSVLILFEE